MEAKEDRSVEDQGIDVCILLRSVQLGWRCPDRCNPPDGLEGEAGHPSSLAAHGPNNAVSFGNTSMADSGNIRSLSPEKGKTGALKGGQSLGKVEQIYFTNEEV